MDYIRTIRNETQHTILATLYIQQAADINELYGTINKRIPQCSTVDVLLGNQGNCFLNGIKLKLVDENIETVFCQVEQRGDEVDRWLNRGDELLINLKVLQNISISNPFG